MPFVPSILETSRNWIWPLDAAKLLIELRSNMIAQFRRESTAEAQIELWREISGRLRSKGFLLPWYACEQKWRQLLTIFQRISSEGTHGKHHGVYWPFYYQFKVYHKLERDWIDDRGHTRTRVVKVTQDADGIPEVMEYSDEEEEIEIDDSDEFITGIRTKTPTYKYNWSREAISLLIDLRSHLEIQFQNRNINKAELWEEISKGLIGEGHQFLTASECQRKWTFLSNKFQDFHNRERHRKRKQSPEEWIYYKSLLAFKKRSREIKSKLKNFIGLTSDVEMDMNTTSPGMTQKDKPNKGDKIWTEGAALRLIELRSSMERQRNGFYARFERSSWREISKKLAKEGYVYHQWACQSKWNSLKVTYKSILSRGYYSNAHSHPSSWKYYNALSMHYNSMKKMKDIRINQLCQMGTTAAQDLAHLKGYQMVALYNIDNGTGVKINWTAQATQLLIEVRCAMNPMFRSNTRHSVLWVSISNSLNEHGHVHSQMSCVQKWRNLLAQYRSLTYGRSRQSIIIDHEWSWPFYKHMQNYFKMDQEFTESRGLIKISGTGKKYWTLAATMCLISLRRSLESFFSVELRDECKLWGIVSDMLYSFGQHLDFSWELCASEWINLETIFRFIQSGDVHEKIRFTADNWVYYDAMLQYARQTGQIEKDLRSVNPVHQILSATQAVMVYNIHKTVERSSISLSPRSAVIPNEK